ncbi:MAG: A/G-specific adenine glycosylase [Thermosediminibacterales bacterium]|nr:A/G-specific adenine glycosylase [Thermosediminibacterales bacterium]
MSGDEIKKKTFREAVLNWYKNNKRDFPWRNTSDPYKIWISEILLQQTNADKAVDPYLKITKNYPTVFDLVDASIEELKCIFSKIGLFYRAERIKTVAADICRNYDGDFPKAKNELLKLKGIGSYTASAIMCFAYNFPCAVVDTNFIRIIERVFGVKSSKCRPRNDQLIWEFADSLVDTENPKDYNYAVLDFASLICRARNPRCSICEIQKICELKIKMDKKLKKEN